MLVKDFKIVERKETGFPDGTQGLIKYILYFDDGTKRNCEGHGFSIKDSDGTFHVAYFLQSDAGSGYVYRYYEAKPISQNGRDYQVKGYSFRKGKPVKEFESTLKNIEPKMQPLEEFMKITMIGKEL